MRSAWWKAAGCAVAAQVSYLLLVRPWQVRWGATDDEVAEALPGDERIAEPASQVTRAITIRAEPEEVWPFVVQLGADRGGFYSYDWLENLFHLGIHSSDVVVTDWQQRAVGDFVAADAGGSAGWYVVDLRPNEVLALQMADLRMRQPALRANGASWEFLWTFAVRRGVGDTTRLVIRERVGSANPFVRLLLMPIGPVSFVMSRKMLLGIKERAEAAPKSVGSPDLKPRGLKPPGRAIRAGLRAPIHLYRWHLGWLLGDRFVLLEHRGRHTGRLHRTVLEVVDHDAGFTRVVVCSGWGERSDWLRNVTADGDVALETAGVRRYAHARRLPVELAADALQHYGEQHPRALRSLARRFLGEEAPEGTTAAANRMATVLPVVEFAT